MKNKVRETQPEEKDLLQILNNLQSSALLEMGSASAVQDFCLGKLEWNGVKMTNNKLMKYGIFRLI